MLLRNPGKVMLRRSRNISYDTLIDCLIALHDLLGILWDLL